MHNEWIDQADARTHWWFFRGMVVLITDGIGEILLRSSWRHRRHARRDQ